MKLIPAKLAFIHRRLWQRDGTYRAACLLGPPPLLGCATAAALWAAMGALHTAPPIPVPPWAQVQREAAAAGQPRQESPAIALPASGPGGLPAGFATGWKTAIHPIEIGAALEVNLARAAVAGATIDQPGLDMAAFLKAGPQNTPFVGVHLAMLAIRTPGIHTLALRLDRSSPEPADCLTRFNLAGRRLLGDVELNITGARTFRFEPTALDLQPGLYPMAIVFGCWHGTQVIGPGQLTLLIRHPGEEGARPATAEEILRPLDPPPAANKPPSR